SSNLAKNQLNVAANGQVAAVQALQKMVDILAQNDLRKLLQIKKELLEMIQAVTKLKQQETDLQKEVTDAGASANSTTLQKKGDDQSKITQTAFVVARKVSMAQRGAEAAPTIEEAANFMGKASQALFKNKQPDSLPPIASSIEKLDD